MITDEYFAILHDAGWSVGDVAFHDNVALVWQVYAHRGDQRIIARAPSQRDSWRLAVEQAAKLSLATS